MSIDDKIEHLYRENKLTEKKGNKPRKNELSYEGFTIESGEYIPANATQTEPMVFCPECNGMMLPYWMDINAMIAVILKVFLKS